MEPKRKFNYMNLLLILVFVVGLGILLYPNISDFFNQRNSSKSISEYDETVAQLNAETRAELFQESTSYNEVLQTNPVGRFADMTEEMKQEYYSTLNLDGSGMMCYLKIDKLGLNLPVYHGTTEDVLQKYVGHIEGTSMPVGGESTHAGLSGHRGLPSAVLFTNLDRMEVGDVFSIIILGEEHFYQIDQIVTVLPNDLSPLAIEPGMDFVTLVTCTPYGENTHRLMIRGARIQKEQAEQAIEESQENTGFKMTREQIVNVIAVVMGSVFLFVGVPILIFPPVAKQHLYLRPWDDNIEEVYKAAIKVSELSTRANWETENVTHEADVLARQRRWDDTLRHTDKLGEEDEERPWDEYDFYDESVDYSEEQDDLRLWDDKVLEKVDQDWSVFDRIKNKFNIKFTDIPDIIERGKVEPPPEDLNPYFKKEINIGEDIVKKSKKGK
jgi:sortase A